MMEKHGVVDPMTVWDILADMIDELMEKARALLFLGLAGSILTVAIIGSLYVVRHWM